VEEVEDDMGAVVAEVGNGVEVSGGPHPTLWKGVSSNFETLLPWGPILNVFWMMRARWNSLRSRWKEKWSKCCVKFEDLSARSFSFQLCDQVSRTSEPRSLKSMPSVCI
jgi:hypothetical protein